MKKENDIFSDLERDIEGDWNNIRTKIIDKQNREIKLRKPKRCYFSSFQEFYRILVDIAYGTKSELEYTIQKLVRRMFYDNDFDRIPNTVIKIWEAIFNPIDFGCITNIKCNSCNKKYDILYKQQLNQVDYSSFEFTINMNEIRQINRIFCPNCGHVLSHIMDGYLVSVSLSPNDTVSSYDKNIGRERRYDIKREF
jgi:hypothetical protein